MARLFDDAATEYLEIDQAVVTSLPLAMACWFNMDVDDVAVHLMSLVDKDSDSKYCNLRALSTDKKVGLHTKANGGETVYTTTSWTINTWHHACALNVAANDRRVFIDGGSKGTSAEAKPLPTDWDRTSIGRAGKSTPAGYMSGYIAEVAIWDLTNWPGATNADKADNFEKILSSLAKGFSPLFYPLGLKAYWPLIRGLNDKVGGYNLTANGTVVAAHPKVIQPCGVL